MNDALKWKVPKLPFWIAEVIVIVGGYIFAVHAPHSLGHWEVFVACVAIGAALGIIPYLLDYRAMGKVIEINALGAVAEKIQNLEQFCAQISAATGRWAAVQEYVGEHAEKTTTTARQIADKMSAEVRDFSEFMKKMNDHEKAALRLEAEKLRRGESEWLQMLVRIMDHVFALQAAAARSNQPKATEQIAQFQNACQGAVRRVGLNAFVAQAEEPFDAARHQLLDTKQKPADGAVVTETLAAGYTFQGKLLRPALVRVRENAPATPAPPPVTSIPPNTPNGSAQAQDTLALEADLRGG
ncbi:MAG: nucleotide exchange factor GrpE [Limisphaerales bacterium]